MGLLAAEQPELPKIWYSNRVLRCRWARALPVEGKRAAVHFRAARFALDMSALAEMSRSFHFSRIWLLPTVSKVKKVFWVFIYINNFLSIHSTSIPRTRLDWGRSQWQNGPSATQLRRVYWVKCGLFNLQCIYKFAWWSPTVRWTLIHSFTYLTLNLIFL